MSHPPTSVLQVVLDPRGRCNRKGLLLAAAILLALQAAVALALWGAGLDLTGHLAMAASAAFCWIGFALISKRLHDLGRSSWWIPGAMLVWLAAIVCLAVAIVLTGDPDLLATGTPSYWLTLSAMLLPLVMTALWLHTAAGQPGDNRFGPEPTDHGFSMPAHAAAFRQRAPFTTHAGTA
jgi:uncharacterized membrane protein YhaH (DUF805 family)